MATSWLFWAVSIVAALLFLGVNRVYVLLFTPALLGICYIFDQFVAVRDYVLHGLHFILTLTQFSRKSTAKKTPKGVHVFIDNSNIFIGAQNFDGYDNQIRLNYTGLAKLLEKDRNVVTRLLAGSTPPSSEKAWDFARQVPLPPPPKPLLSQTPTHQGGLQCRFTEKSEGNQQRTGGGRQDACQDTDGVVSLQ